jgi:mannose-6-phosphate isomerase-like protein (cupin superfamily)
MTKATSHLVRAFVIDSDFWFRISVFLAPILGFHDLQTSKGAVVSQQRAEKGFLVPAGKDRFNENNLSIWGLIPLSTKLSSRDTAGELFIFEHTHMGEGGPPRHVHHEQDEWFYVVRGEFTIEVGEDKFRLKPGDSLFAPRKVPHAWAHVGDGPGSLITIVSPVGTFETFLRETTRHPTLPSPAEIERAFEANGMKVLGPPLKVD